MLKIGVVGSYYDALPFSALGFEVHATDSSAQAVDELERMREDGQFAAIFAVGIVPNEGRDARSSRGQHTPVILLPGGKRGQNPSDTDAFVGELRDASRRALGIDTVSGTRSSK